MFLDRTRDDVSYELRSLQAKNTYILEILVGFIGGHKQTVRVLRFDESKLLSDRQ